MSWDEQYKLNPSWSTLIFIYKTIISMLKRLKGDSSLGL